MVYSRYFLYAFVALLYIGGIKTLITGEFSHNTLTVKYSAQGTDAVVIGVIQCILATFFLTILLRKNPKK